MLEGFYTAAAGILTQERTLNVVANNLSNVKTPGFRADRVITTTFEQAMLTCRQNGGDAIIGKGAPIRLVETVPTDYDEDLLTETGRPFDLALLGDGYFNIQGEDQVYLTRNGHFDIDEEGFLTLPGFGRVLGQGGEIEIGGSYFTVEEDGAVYDQDEKLIDTLLVTIPQAEAAADGEQAASPLRKQSNGMFLPADPNLNLPAASMKVEQGLLESSNIDLNREYTLVMETMRAFQSNSAALRIIDDINSKSTQICSIG